MSLLLQAVTERGRKEVAASVVERLGRHCAGVVSVGLSTAAMPVTAWTMLSNPLLWAQGPV